jgi:hypothetical protein
MKQKSMQINIDLSFYVYVGEFLNFLLKKKVERGRQDMKKFIHLSFFDFVADLFDVFATYIDSSKAKIKDKGY